MKFIFAALLALPAMSAHADVNQAKALYNEGSRLLAQKQYQAAITQYEKSLQAEPRYAYSYKQIGTCKYYLGDKAGALAAYEKYHAAVPNDAGVQGMITRLKAAGTAPAAPAAASKSGSVELWHGGFALSLGLGFNTYGMSDWNAQFANPSAGTTGGSIGSGVELGLNAGFALNSSMKIGLDIDYLMASSQVNTSSSGYSSVTNYNLPILWLGPEFDYTFAKFGSMRLRGQLGVGYIMLAGAGGNSKDTSGGNYSATLSYSGSGFGLKVGPALDWAINRTFSIGLDLGYRMASIGTVNDTYTYTVGGPSTTVVDPKPLQKYDPKTGKDLGNLALDYGGLHSRLGLNFVF